MFISNIYFFRYPKLYLRIFDKYSKRSITFIDESGTIEKNDPQSDYYVLTAVVMQEKGMKFLHQKTQELKKEIWEIVQGLKKQMPIQFELHMTEIKDSKGFFKPLRGKKNKAETVITSINLILIR